MSRAKHFPGRPVLPVYEPCEVDPTPAPTPYQRQRRFTTWICAGLAALACVAFVWWITLR